MTDSPQDKTLIRLVSELTLEERHSFLEKLRGQSVLSFEPLHENEEAAGKEDNFELQYAQLPWISRIGYKLLSYLKGQPPLKVFEDSMVHRLGRKISAETPGLYDYHRNMLLLSFFDQLVELKEGARFFYTALDMSVNRDKGGFYAFLGSLEMGELHHRLETETIPELFTERTDASERELRQAALRAMEAVFSAITDEQRNGMYYNARSLNCLKELASFGFDRIIAAFGSGSGGQTCPVNVVREQLVSLNNILFSLREPPALPLLESLFIYRLQERSGEPGFDMTGEMHSLLGTAEDAIVTIRDFNRRVPLTRILRCAGRDMSLVPHQVSGGEDWFAIYREYWKKRVEANVLDYTRNRKHQELVNSFKHFLKGMNLKTLEHAASDSNPRGLPVSESFALSFLLTFHAAIFVNDVNTVLRPILIDGDFFKKENRSEFTGAYNDIRKIEEDIKKFDAKIAPNGEYGTHYYQAREDLSALSVKRRKIQQAVDEITLEAGGIIIRSRDAMVSLVNLLNGILRKEAGGKYDTLVNFEKLAGKNPDVFIDGIAEVIRQFQEALRILKDIDALGAMR